MANLKQIILASFISASLSLGGFLDLNYTANQFRKDQNFQTYLSENQGNYNETMRKRYEYRYSSFRENTDILSFVLGTLATIIFIVNGSKKVGSEIYHSKRKSEEELIQ